MNIPEREGVKEKSCVDPKVYELIRADYSRVYFPT